MFKLFHKSLSNIKKLAAILLSASFIFVGCESRYTKVTVEPPRINVSSSNIDADKDSIRSEEFDMLCDELFLHVINQSLINLHYYIKDKDAYNIKEYNKKLGTVSYNKMKEEISYYQDILDKLADDKSLQYDRLSKDQKLTRDTIEEILDANIIDDEMILYYEPLESTIGDQVNIPILLADYELRDREDIEEYLSLVSSIVPYFESIIEFERRKSDAGLFMSDSSADAVIESCKAYAFTSTDNFMIDTFDERLDAIEGLSSEEISYYKEYNSDIIMGDFVDAYEMLIDEITELKGTGNNEYGMCYLPKGKEYFEHIIRSEVGTSYSTLDKLSDAIYESMEEAITIYSSMTELGLADKNLINIHQYPGDTPEESMEYLQEAIKWKYPKLEGYTYNINKIPTSLQDIVSPAYYLTPCIDDYMDDNKIYIKEEYSSPSKLYSTLAHEGIPGHLYQTVYYDSISPHPIRQVLGYNSYTEGWATYAQYQSYYLDDTLTEEEADMLSAIEKLALAVYAYVDMRVNYYGDDIDDIKKIVNQYYDMSDDSIKNIYDLVVQNPTNYIKYYVGYMEIQDMRDEAQQRLGKNFDEVSFHKFILDMGPASFKIIKKEFIDYLIEKERQQEVA